MARKAYYIYNEETLSYEPLKRSFRKRMMSWLRTLIFGAVLGIALFGWVSYWHETPAEIEQKREQRELVAQYQLLSRQVDEALVVLGDVQQRDDNLYRVMLQAEPVSKSLRDAHGSTAKYESLLQLPHGELIANTTQKVDRLNRQLYVQATSFKELLELGRTHEDRLACIPAIQPVANKDLKRTASGYGYRIDPIYKTRRFHNGMDFSAPVGTPIYATGNGKVTFSGWKVGYGNVVKIDHGHNYETLYAHCSKLLVQKNQQVVRGEKIALVGNTGKSTGPHLHYEVIYKGQHVNPVNYYFFDLSPELYDQMIQLAENQGQVMD